MFTEEVIAINREIKDVLKIHNDLSALPSLVTREKNCLLAMTCKIIEDIEGFSDWRLYKVRLPGGTVVFRLSPFNLCNVTHAPNENGIIVDTPDVQMVMPNYVFSYGLTEVLAKSYLELANNIIKIYKENICLKKKSL